MVNKLKLILVITVFFGSLFYLLFFFLFKSNQKSKATNNLKTSVIFESSIIDSQTAKLKITIKSNNSAPVPIQGYVLNFTFDKNKLQVKNIEYVIGGPSHTTVADVFSTLQRVNQEGKLRVMGEFNSSIGTQVNQEGVNVANVYFNLIDQNQSIINLKKGFIYTINSDNTLSEDIIPATNIDLKTGSTSINPSINLTQAVTGSYIINLKTKFQGINSKPVNNSMTIKVKITGCGITPQEKTTILTSDEKGVWSGKVGFDLNNCQQGMGYTLYLKGQKHLQKKVCDISPSEQSPGTYRCSEGKIKLNQGENNLDLNSILLLSGDLDQNGVVDSTDISLIRNNLGKKDTDILNKADINLDGVVDTQDFSLILGALSVKVDEM